MKSDARSELPIPEVAESMERELSQQTGSAFPDGRTLFHYTDASGLLGIVSEKKLRATHYRYLNDRAELVRGEKIVQEIAEERARTSRTNVHRLALDGFVREHAKQGLTKAFHVFVASFSEEGNLLSQWRAYGANGAGYSLGFSHFRLPEIERPEATLGFDLYQCVYNEPDFRQAVHTRFDQILTVMDRHAATPGFDASDVQRTVAGCAISHLLRSAAATIPRLKDRAFAEEREWRLVAFTIPGSDTDVLFRPSAGGVVPYVLLDLCGERDALALAKVYVGPTHDSVSGQMTASMLLNKHGYAARGVVEVSGIPFRAG